MKKLPKKLPRGTVVVDIPEECKECEWLMYDCCIGQCPKKEVPCK